MKQILCLLATLVALNVPAAELHVPQVRLPLLKTPPTIDGEVKGWFRDDTPRRFEAYGWHVVPKVDGHDVESVDAAIRAAIARVVPGYGRLGDIDRTRKEFVVDGRTFHEPRFATADGRARCRVTPPPAHAPAPGEFRLMTLRSEGQFNTVVYEEEDLYRGNERRDVVMMNADDARRLLDVRAQALQRRGRVEVDVGNVRESRDRRDAGRRTGGRRTRSGSVACSPFALIQSFQPLSRLPDNPCPRLLNASRSSSSTPPSSTAGWRPPWAASTSRP